MIKNFLSSVVKYIIKNNTAIVEHMVMEFSKISMAHKQPTAVEIA
ncbi:hypothetical protein CTK_C24320 [Clostridium tyrobutyricum]|nr:hypothetical protein CTK_C24320 [Clostridium tyrobutyricum]